jgi:hypothetical protein
MELHTLKEIIMNLLMRIVFFGTVCFVVGVVFSAILSLIMYGGESVSRGELAPFELFRFFLGTLGSFFGVVGLVGGLSYGFNKKS